MERRFLLSTTLSDMNLTSVKSNITIWSMFNASTWETLSCCAQIRTFQVQLKRSWYEMAVNLSLNTFIGTTPLYAAWRKLLEIKGRALASLDNETSRLNLTGFLNCVENFPLINKLFKISLIFELSYCDSQN